MAKTKKKPTTALAKRVPEAVPVNEHPLAIIERVAKDKDVDVEKLGKLIDLQKDMLRTQAKIDFDQAFAVMAPLLPVIKKGGTITNKGGGARSRYARLGEDIHPVIKPILALHGFAIRHQTEWPTPERVRVIGVLSHRSGHSETSAFEGPADSSDYRSYVQSLGSTVSYGRRYTTIDLLNLTVHGVDNDGATSPAQRVERPDTRTAPVATHAASGEPISEPQCKRLGVIIKNSGRDVDAVREWLHRRYGWVTTRKVTREAYDAVCAAIEAPGSLPEGGAF